MLNNVDTKDFVIEITLGNGEKPPDKDCFHDCADITVFQVKVQ